MEELPGLPVALAAAIQRAGILLITRVPETLAVAESALRSVRRFLRSRHSKPAGAQPGILKAGVLEVSGILQIAHLIADLSDMHDVAR